MKKPYIVLCFVLIQIILVSLVFFVVQKPVVVTFDATRVRGLFIRQLANQPLTEAQIKKVSLRYKQQLEKTLSTYSANHQVVIVDSKQVLAGGVDVTDRLMQELSLSMKGAV